ncbi:MAG: hypothetical protein ABIA08_01115 [bacterium]
MKKFCIDKKLFKNILNKFKYLILVFAVFSILLPEPVSAVFGVGDVGLFDIFDNLLQGISERTGPMFAAVISVLSFYLVGLGLLALSTNFLESFISQQGQWMTNLEPMTQAGWNFTVGLSNMFLILILLVIAFGFILKIENIQAKKALPRLLGVAVLLNFSWVFVKMLVDISQILYNTVLPNESLFTTVMGVFFQSAGSVVVSIIAWIAALGAAWSIPMASSFFQILFSILFTTIILPNIIIWALQAIFFFLLAVAFLAFAFLFAARVFVIQILIILSPLAFLALILPQTKSFWTQWYKTLLEWLLLGVFFLFFLTLGFGAIRFLAPQGIAALNIPGLALANIQDQLVYYFAIFIYMAVLLFVGKSFMPKGAQALIDFGKGIAGTVATRGLMPMGRGTIGEMKNAANKQLANERKMELAQEAGNPIQMNRRQKMGMTLGKWARQGVELGYKVAGTTLTEENMKGMTVAEAEANKINDPNLLLSKIKNARRSGDTSKEMGLLTGGISKGKGWKKLLQEDGSIDKLRITSLASQANASGAIKQAETLARGYMHEMDDNDLSAMGFKLSEKDKEKYGNIKGMLFAKSKGDDLKQFKEGTWLDKQGLIEESILKNIDGAQIGKLAIEFDSFSDDFNKTAGRKGLAWFKDNNPKAAVYVTGNAAQDLGLRPLAGGEDRKRLLLQIRDNRERQRERQRIEEMAPEQYAAYRTATQRERSAERPIVPTSPEYEKGRRTYLKNRGFRRTAEEQKEFTTSGGQTRETIRRSPEESQREKDKHIEDLRKYSERYKQLKENPARTAEEQLEYIKILEKMRDKRRQIKEIGGDLRMTDLEKELGGDLDTIAESELANIMAREKETLPREELERMERSQRINLEKLENEYKVLGKAKPPDFEKRAEGYKKGISDIKDNLKYIQKQKRLKK